MAFDITSVLKGVSGPDAGKEQIEYIPVDQIDPDPNNFYSLDGLDELAGNIELIGLQQPLRVRPGEDGRFIVVSGHRRRAAILMIRDGGSEQFKDGVPCIVDRLEESPAMRELRLIYANASTRVMGPAEISKQAERTEMLLYQLKEEGIIEFPGRMRDHVAEACKISKTKLARLHAIRKNLAPDILEHYFDKGTLSEATAYALSQKDHDLQRWILDNYRSTHNDADLPEWRVRDFAREAEAMDKLTCKLAGGSACIHKREHVERMWRHGYHGYDGCIRGDVARCCMDCENLASCSASCQRCAETKKRLKADDAAKRKSERETKAADEAILKEQRELEEFQAGLYWKRLGDALKAAGADFWWLQDNIKRHDFDRSGKFNRQLCSYRLSPETIEALLDGKPADNDEAEIPTPFIWEQDVLAAQSLAKMADLLDVSIDYLMLRTDDPNPCPDPDTAAAGWSTGDPPAEGRYLCTVDLGNKPAEQKCDWKAGQWTAYGRPVDDVFKVIAWYPLPDGPYYPREHWDEVAEEEEDDDDD